MTEMVGRREIVEYLRDQLIGPFGGQGEILPRNDPPNQRYMTGILFPKDSSIAMAVADDIDDDSSGEVGEERGDDPIVLSSQNMPASVGLSFLVSGDQPIDIAVAAGQYDSETATDGNEFDEDSGTAHSSRVGADQRIDIWRRVSLAGVTPLRPSDSGKLIPILPGRANLYSKWRPYGPGYLVTVAVVNARDAGEGRPKADDCLYQVEMQCTAGSGRIRSYPSVGSVLRDPEDEENALVYRNRPIYAIGHGCSADWDEGDSDRTDAVRTCFMPEENVPPPDFSLQGFSDVLNLDRLSTIYDNKEDTLELLGGFVEAYAEWILAAYASASDVPPELDAAKARLLSRLQEASSRMSRGIQALRDSDELCEAFALANRAMLMQMVHGRPEYGGERKKLGTALYREPDYASETDISWRPFQLAFLLLTLEGVGSNESPERDYVDLIWFPTGGGKTEAYLALAAVVIFLRRLRAHESGDDGGGTTVITRYTLRLLTAQQFQRSAALVMACEVLRRSRQDLGSESISIGMWVGRGSSPNTYQQADDLYARYLSGEDPAQGFQLEFCPWCGTEVIPKQRPADPGRFGIRVSDTSFSMFCPSPACPFHDGLPTSAVDQALYDLPPTLLIGTIDKFARMVWDPRAGVFLGVGKPGPDVIIQDELHLISGPLGTIAALYEAAFDVVMTENGTRPKVVASTATIRNAASQVRGLFGREVHVFPPSGFDADDSYFVRFDRQQSGRLYVGVMPQAHTPLTAEVRVAAGLLQAPAEITMTDTEQNGYWTLVAYHNSLRELGKTVTLAADDIPAWIDVTATDQSRSRQLLGDDDVIELTSNIPGAHIPRRLEALGRDLSSGRAVSVVACTNMISVGVDIQRLALMLVIGQPKTTSEYIQATSRVGRGEVPGLVVTLYSPAKSRDRSHYESFRAYHGSMYRFIEPTAVTPLALPARTRALHAAVVILMRYVAGLSDDGAAAAFDSSDPTVRRTLGLLIERLRLIDDGNISDTVAHVDQITSEWEHWRDEALAMGPPLHYESSGAQNLVSLLRRYNQTGTGWPTLDSMRNVDPDVLVKVEGE